MKRFPFVLFSLVLLLVWVGSEVAREATADTLIVLNKADATASLIDLKSGGVVATAETGHGPHEVAVTRDGKWALVTNYGTREQAGSALTVIDVVAGKAVKTIDLGNYHRPHGVQWLPDGKSALVTAEENKALLIVDVQTGTVKQAIQTDQDVSHMVVLTPDSKRAFVANIGSGSVTAIDLMKPAKILNLPTGQGAEGIDITPDGKQIWVTNRAADTVSVIDTSNLKVLTTLECKSFPIRARITADGKHVLVSNARSGDIAVFDTATREELRRISIPLEAGSTEGRLFGSQFGNSSVPIGILVHPDGKRAYVAHANADTISILDLETWKPVGSLKAGKEPDGLGYSGLTVNN